jgi:uncharacterized phage infection (PIP) family protein YhgE
MSLFIWISTGILFKLTTYLVESIDYQVFCFFVSLLLSGLAGFYLTNRLVKNVSGSSRILLALANILLLYTSANGIQSGYCFISQPSQNENVQESSLIPFMLAKPWLPDKFQASAIQDLEGKNKLLERRVYELERYTGDKFDLIKEIEKLKAGNQSLVDSVNGLRERLDNTTDDSQLRRELEELRVDNQKLRDANRELNSKLEQMTEQYSSLKNNYNTLREKCAGMQDNYKRLTERAEEYNRLQNEWREKIGNPELRALRKNIITVVGGDFYKKFLETPINLE